MSTGVCILGQSRAEILSVKRRGPVYFGNPLNQSMFTSLLTDFTAKTHTGVMAV